MLIWFKAFVYLILLILLGSFAYGAHRAAPWLPTKRVNMDRLFRLIKKHGGNNDNALFVDLGCGDGRLVCEAARRGMHAIGYEVSIIQYFHAKWNVSKLSEDVRGRAKIRYKDFWRADISYVDVIYFFLTPKIYTKMQKKLQSELKSGALVLAFVWPFENWEPVEVSSDKGQHKVYVYRSKH